MFTVITKAILKSRITRENAQRQKKFIPWDRVDKIALILEKQENFNKNLIDTFIQDTKKYIEVYFIEPSSKEGSYKDWQCFSRKDKSLLNLPNKNTETELKNTGFDAVINTCDATNLFALAICSALPAYLKCSANNAFNLADLVIKKNESLSLRSYLDETVKYLKMIKV
jgi:hypothetical protein